MAVLPNIPKTAAVRINLCSHTIRHLSPIRQKNRHGGGIGGGNLGGILCGIGFGNLGNLGGILCGGFLFPIFLHWHGGGIGIGKQKKTGTAATLAAGGNLTGCKAAAHSLFMTCGGIGIGGGIFAAAAAKARTPPAAPRGAGLIS